MERHTLLPLLLFTALLSACGATDNEQEKVSLDNDPRVGDKVSQVCFVSNIRGWKPVDNDRNSLVVTMSNRDEYKLKLSGSCDPNLAMMTTAIIPRGGSTCFQRGDKVKTDGDLSKGFGSGCTIMSVNKWDPDALIKQAEKEAEEENN